MNVRPLLLILLALSGISASASELKFRVIGIAGDVILERNIPAVPESLGILTHENLEHALLKHQIAEYQGSEGGVVSIERLGNAVEVLSDTEMNSYGWCYKVDGKSPDLMPDQVILTGQESTIEWFYAYAHLDRDRWTSMCVPAEHAPVVD